MGKSKHSNRNITIKREIGGGQKDIACGQIQNENKGGKLHESSCKD